MRTTPRYPRRLAGGRTTCIAARRHLVDGQPVLDDALPAMAAAPLR